MAADTKTYHEINHFLSNTAVALQCKVNKCRNSWYILLPNYCKFTIIHENFIFANIRKFERLQIQNSRETFAYTEFQKTH